MRNTRQLRSAAKTAAKVFNEELKEARKTGNTQKIANREEALNKALDRLSMLDKHYPESE